MEPAGSQSPGGACRFTGPLGSCVADGPELRAAPVGFFTLLYRRFYRWKVPVLVPVLNFILRFVRVENNRSSKMALFLPSDGGATPPANRKPDYRGAGQ